VTPWCQTVPLDVSSARDLAQEPSTSSVDVIITDRTQAQLLDQSMQRSSQHGSVLAIAYIRMTSLSFVLRADLIKNFI